MSTKQSPNRFIALLTISATLLFLVVIMLSFSQNRDDRSRAYKSLGCENNNQCPTNTECQEGLCVLVTPSVTQTPLAMVDATTLQETITPIPAVYVSLTPTPEPGFFEQYSRNVNKTIAMFFNLIGSFFEKLLTK